jgi:hypothetical protein
MRRKTIVAVCFALVGAFALTAAGCGGGSKSAATTAATTEATTTQTQATTTQTQATSTASKPTTTSSGLGGIASAANCKDLADLGQKFSSAFTGAANGNDLKKEAALLKEFADKTPSDIRPDFEVVADYLGKVAAVAGSIKPGTTPDAATLAKLQKVATGVDQQKLTTASKNIGAWVTKNCHK